MDHGSDDTIDGLLAAQLPRRVTRMEKVMFGHFDERGGKWIDGLAQSLDDLKSAAAGAAAEAKQAKDRATWVGIIISALVVISPHVEWFGGLWKVWHP